MAVKRSFTLVPFLAELGAEVLAAAAVVGKLVENVCFLGEGVSGVSGGVVVMAAVAEVSIGVEDGFEIVRDTWDRSRSE